MVGGGGGVEGEGFGVVVDGGVERFGLQVFGLGVDGSVAVEGGRRGRECCGGVDEI